MGLVKEREVGQQALHPFQQFLGTEKAIQGIVPGRVDVVHNHVLLHKQPPQLLTASSSCLFIAAFAGDLVPAVVLPEELEDAVARAVLGRAGAARYRSCEPDR